MNNILTCKPSRLVWGTFIIATAICSSLTFADNTATGKIRQSSSFDITTTNSLRDRLESSGRVYGGYLVKPSNNYNYFASIRVPAFKNVKRSDLPPSLQFFYPFIPKSALSSPPHLCGATVISDQAVVTAAHCFRGSISVVGNELTFTIYPSEVEVSIGAKSHLVGLRRRVSHVLLHKNYKASSGENDIAVVILSKKIPKSKLFTARIWKRPAGNRPSNLFMMGLGATKKVDMLDLTISPKLKEAAMGFSTSGSCPKSPTLLCTEPSGNGPASVCSRDSGGPLVFRRKKEGQTMPLVVLLGIAKSITGSSCEDKNSKTVYTYVFPYRKALFRNELRKGIDDNSPSNYWKKLSVPSRCAGKTGVQLLLCS